MADNGEYSEPSTSTELVIQPKYRAPTLIPFAGEWQAMREMAEVLVKSGFLPETLKTAEQALAVLLAGREVGLPPMQAIRSIHIVKGKPSLSAEAMLALAYANIPGFKFEVSGNEQVCKATGQRPGASPVVISFSISDAQRAGLASGDNWKKYPAAMLRARATSACLRIVAPDAIRGIHTPDEIGASEREIEVNRLAAARGVDVPAVAVNTVVVEEADNGNRPGNS